MSSISRREKPASDKPREKHREREKDKATTQKLSLKGSAKLVVEFFEYSINTILYQRGVYPNEDFTTVKKYNLNMLVTTDDEVKSYIKRILSQLNKWMSHGRISKLVIVITSKETGEHVERWQFDVDVLKAAPAAPGSSSSSTNASAADHDENNAVSSHNQHQHQQQSQAPAATQSPPSEKPLAQIQSEISALIRQITASVTFLPALDAHGACTFNVLVYADSTSEVPLEWGDSDAKDISGEAERVALRSFSTGEGAGNMRVGVVVGYKLAE